MPPDVFIPRFKEKLQFTHRSDMDAVLKLQEKVFHDKAGKNKVLILTNLSRAEAEVAIKALRHYRVLRRLEITRSKLADVESFLELLFKALSSKSTIAELSLAENELGVKGAMLAVRKALNENRSLRILGLKKNGITEEGGQMLAEALLQRPDAALKIELDGNDLGTGALILALWAKKAKKIKKEQVTVVHSSVELLAKRIQGIQALAVDKAIAAGKSVTFKDLCRLTSLSIHLTASEDFAWQLAAVADAFNTLQQLVELSVAFGRVRSQWITSNGIGDEGCRALGLEVSKLLQLRTLSLDLKCNEVGSSGCRALGHGLGTLIQLTSLSLLLRANHVSHYGCQALRDTLSKLTNLAALSLDLQGNQVCGSYGCRALCDGLGKLMQLTILSLDLRCNRVGDEGCQVLGDSLRKLSKLTSLSLDLNSNLIYETGWQALGDGLGKCLQLTTLSLDVGYNKISPEGCQAVSKVLGNRLSKLPKLTTLSLDLASNGFAPEAFAALRERLKHVAKLQISGQVC